MAAHPREAVKLALEGLEAAPDGRRLLLSSGRVGLTGRRGRLQPGAALPGLRPLCSRGTACGVGEAPFLVTRHPWGNPRVPAAPQTPLFTKYAPSEQKS